MLKKLFIVSVPTLIIFLVILSGELWVRSNPFAEQYFYLPNRKFWNLEKATNLFGQHDGKKELILYHVDSSRYDKIKVKKTYGTERIICIGTSSTEGFGVDIKDSFVRLLQDKLDNRFGAARFEVINGARGGYASYQLLVYFEDILLKLSPDIVVLYLGSNDTFYYMNAITNREYYEQVKKAAENIKYDNAKIKRLFKYGLAGLNPLYCLLAESRVFGYIYAKLFDPSLGTKFRLKTVQQVPPRDQEYVLKRFAFLSKKHNFKLILMPEVPRRNFDQLTHYYNLMKRVAEEENLIFADAKPILREYRDEVVLLDDVHLTVFGNRMIADILFDTIKKLY